MLLMILALKSLLILVGRGHLSPIGLSSVWLTIESLYLFTFTSESAEFAVIILVFSKLDYNDKTISLFKDYTKINAYQSGSYLC